MQNMLTKRKQDSDCAREGRISRLIVYAFTKGPQRHKDNKPFESFETGDKKKVLETFSMLISK